MASEQTLHLSQIKPQSKSDDQDTLEILCITKRWNEDQESTKLTKKDIIHETKKKPEKKDTTPHLRR